MRWSIAPSVGWTLICSAVLGADVDKPFLVFDGGGHTAAVNKVCFLDAEHLASVSNDKTLRIWHLGAGETCQIIRPPIGAGLSGALYALAASPDGRWLAAGGHESPGEDHGIFLVRRSDATLVSVLRGHGNVILDLKFSRDSRWLASASADKTCRLWNVETRRAAVTLRGHRDEVYGVAFSPRANQVATASLDGVTRVWSLPDGQPARSFPAAPAPLQCVDWSPDGKLIAAGGADQSVRLWSTDGTLVRHFQKLGNHVTAVRFSADSNRLLYALGGAGDTDGGFIIDLPTSRRERSLTGHMNSVLDGTFSSDSRLAATADANGEIRVWSVPTGKLIRRFASRSVRPWSAGWDSSGTVIAWGNRSEYRSPNDRGPLEQAFSLSELDFVPLPSEVRRAVVRRDAKSLDLLDATTMVVRQGDQSTRLSSLAGLDQIRCYTLLDDERLAVGSDFGLQVLDSRTGRPVRGLSGHMGTVWALAPSPDQRWLLSAGDDQTLRVWDWRQGELRLSLFFADRQWIAWTPGGFYAASPGGEQLMGWQLSSSQNQLGKFFPAAQFHQSLYDPPSIRNQWSVTGTRDGEASRREDSIPSAVTDITQVLPPEVTIVEPRINSQIVSEPQLEVRATARRRTEHPIVSLRLLVDGRPYEGRKGVYVVASQAGSEAETSANWTIELTPGTHRIIVQAETSVSRSTSPPVEVTYQESTEPTQARLPDLYVLAVGVAAYSGTLKLSYADRDAEQVVARLESQGSPLFRKIHVRLLRNEQATRREFLQGLSWLRREATQADVSIVFYSGHGARDETSMFYLLPVDVDPQDLLATGVSGTQFKDSLATIPGRVLVLLDACHAGASGGDRRKGVYVAPDELVRDLVTDDYGVIVMCSSMGQEYSQESEAHRQGFFTVALMEALDGQADYNQDGVVYLTEIDTYVADRVKELTQGGQHPVTSKPATIRSFPLTRSTAASESAPK